MIPLHPRGVAAVDATGATVPDGTYAAAVVDGVVTGLQAFTLVLLLEPGQDASDVPAGTPVGTIVLVKA